MSSHREAPAISKDAVADSTDLYAFVSPDDPGTVGKLFHSCQQTLPVTATSTDQHPAHRHIAIHRATRLRRSRPMSELRPTAGRPTIQIAERTCVTWAH